MLHVILGSDRALAKRSLADVLGDADPSGLDTDRLDAASTPFDVMYAAVTAVPFFGTRRVIVVEGLLEEAEAKRRKGGKAKSESDLSRLVQALPETTTLVLFDPELGELSSSVRKQLPDDVPIAINEAPRGSMLLQFTVQRAREQGAEMDRKIAQQLLDRLFPGYWPQAPQNRAYDKPPSIEQLNSEIDKLALAAYPGRISAALVDELVPRRAEERVFPLLDAVVAGNQRGALVEIENGRRAGDDVNRTLHQVYQQIELSVGAIARGRPADTLQAARALGVSSTYRMNKVTEAAHRANVHPARQLRLALETDRRLKTGRLRNPDEALTDLVVRATSGTENR